MRRIRIAVVMLVISASFVTAASAADAADPPTTLTIHQMIPIDIGVAETLPCLAGSPLYEETGTVDFYAHAVLRSDGTGTTGLLVKGPIQLTPANDSSLPTFTGHVLTSGEAQISPDVNTVELTLDVATVLMGSDGSHLEGHVVEHLTVNRAISTGGVVTVLFSHEQLHFTC